MSRDKNTTYMRRPDEAPKATTSGARDVRHWFSRNRHQLVPMYGVVLWYTLADVVGHPVRVLSACVVLAGVLYWYGYKLGDVGAKYLRLERSRRYAACTALAYGAWYAWATRTGDPSGRDVLVLILGTCLLASPWWYRHRVRGSLPVTFDESINRKTRQVRLREVKNLLDDWAGLVSAAQLQGSKLVRVEFTRWSILLHIRFRRGMAVEDFTVKRMAKLESAFDARRKSARMESVDDSAQLAIIRIMVADPHQSPVPMPDDGDAIGLFETGEPVEIEMINTLVGGETGAGKSGLVNALMCVLMRKPHVAIVGVDMKPSAIELGRYAPVMDTLASTPAEVKRAFDAYLGEMVRRGEIMRRAGIREWICTEQDPLIAFLVDEAWAVKQNKLGDKMDACLALNRAYGGLMVIVTQHPTNKSVSGEAKANTIQKIAYKTETPVGERVIFGDGASNDGWRASTLIPANRPGSFLIRNRRYRKPLLARAFWVSDAYADAQVEIWAPYRTTVNWSGAESVPEPRDKVSLDKESQDIVDADVVDDRPAWNAPEPDPVLAAVQNGLSSPKEIATETGISLATVYRRLADLKSAGLVWNPARGVWKPRSQA